MHTVSVKESVSYKVSEYKESAGWKDLIANEEKHRRNDRESANL